MTTEQGQHFNDPIMDIIKKRYSVRTYRPEKLSESIKKQLAEYAQSIQGPFLPKVRLEFIDNFDALEEKNGKIGTYGIIKGAPTYISAIVKSGEQDLEQIGYVLEKFILFAASIQQGTCWMGGTFRRSDFAKIVELQEDESMPIVTPIGHPQDKKSTLESFMRFSAGSNKRKPWKELFFDETFDVSLGENQQEEYRKALEAVRLAPSASNKQPWRILKSGKNYHFYLKQNKGYSKGLGFNIQRVDMGIAMCHFEMVLQELGIKGSWKSENLQVDIKGIEGMVYSITWIEDLG